MIPVLAFLRSLFSVIVLFPLWTLIISLLCILHTTVSENERISNWLVSTWGSVTCWMFGVEVRAHGLDKIPKGTFVLLFNHKSFFDIFALVKVIPDIRFGAKVELFKIPVFGRAMRRMGILPIARGNVEKVIRVYKAAEERTRNGARFALAPEGGRNTGADALLPFKSGPFLFGISAKSPLLPVVIRGAGRVWPKGYLVPQAMRLKSTIDLYFLDVVPVENLGFEKNAEKKNFLQKKVYQIMNDKIQELRVAEATLSATSIRSPDQSAWTQEDESL